MTATRFILWLASAALTAAALSAEPEAASGRADSPPAGQAVPLPPPLPPSPPNPVETLRQLLAKTPAERESVLAQKSEKQRDYLRRRLRDFDALDPVEREMQLRLLQLRFYLLPLLKFEATNRADALRAVPAADRNLVQERLQEWDSLPPERRKELLQNEPVLRYFPRFEISTQAPSWVVGNELPVEQRQKLEADLLRFRESPADQRERVYQRFRRFLSLSDREKSKALLALPSSDRQHTERTIQAFAKLPPDQQDKCLEAFYKFANMAPEERIKFLDNAARWDAMTPEERRAWRELVAQSPPSPPGMGLNLPLPPSLPPPAPAPPPSRAVALTNAPRQ